MDKIVKINFDVEGNCVNGGRAFAELTFKNRKILKVCPHCFGHQIAVCSLSDKVKKQLAKTTKSENATTA